MLGPVGKIAGLYDRVHAWASKPGATTSVLIEQDDAGVAWGDQGGSGGSTNCSTGRSPPQERAVDIADAAATKVFSTERVQRIGRLAEEIVGKYGNPRRRALPSCCPGWTRRPSETW